jgi:hypothetical protein
MTALFSGSSFFAAIYKIPIAVSCAFVLIGAAFNLAPLLPPRHIWLPMKWLNAKTQR